VYEKDRLVSDWDGYWENVQGVSRKEKSVIYKCMDEIAGLKTKMDNVLLSFARRLFVDRASYTDSFAAYWSTIGGGKHTIEDAKRRIGEEENGDVFTHHFPLARSTGLNSVSTHLAVPYSVESWPFRSALPDSAFPEFSGGQTSLLVLE
jgi:hypothetical protein